MTLRQLIARFRWRVGATVTLVLVEAGIELLFPLFIGIAINDLLEDSSRGVVMLAGLGVAALAVGSARRFFDTRAYTGIYEAIATELVSREQRRGTETSKIAARTTLAGEFVEFLEDSMPEIVTASIGTVGMLVIIAGLEHTEAARAMLRNAGCPVVEIMDVDGEPVDAMVGISHRRAGRMMARAIIDEGYRRIGFLGTKMPLDHRARKRFEGFTETLAKFGLEVEDREFYDGGSAMTKGREMTQTILERSPKLDFLYYSNDMIAAGGLLYAIEEGLDVPGRLGMAGFNGVELINGLPRRLATMDAMRREIGEAAARVIAERSVEGETAGGERIELTPTLSHGETLRRD